ncbi:phosphotransferase [Thalassotalea psychrophila]|uniref:Phosphotransferase n=1 Tax=Thalassotalea psychrophila TaxID=3065647 RepID=A0ABY9TV08_9GAMM|nr:phosphotransferase [Colwelliaceae bacterium SQ149]
MSALTRKQKLGTWLAHIFPDELLNIAPLSGDAGFRVYYRLILDENSYIIVDAPPEKLNNLAFVSLAHSFRSSGLIVPEIIHYDEANGFMCLSDFGDVLLSDKLDETTIAALYEKAIKLLPKIQKVSAQEQWPLPVYDAPFLQLEVDIFSDWLVHKHLNISLTIDETKQLQQCFDLLIASALEQPQVTVHRDFHSRNLMLIASGDIAVIDFQDAVKGPFTYDLVSLLRDCYVRWEDELIEPHVHNYYLNNKVDVSYQQFTRWFDFMGLQRHIKASGIFARLYHRDGKSGYLKDIPLTLSYIIDIAAKYPELTFLSNLVKSKVLPSITKLASQQKARV